MASLPTGTVTFLFTDIEGSTRLATELAERWPPILARHHALMREAISAHEGVEVMTEGDAFFVVFRAPVAGVSAAADAQRLLEKESWPAGGEVHVRMGMHTGEAVLGGDNYVGLDVHRAARIASAGHGGQALISETTRVLVDRALPEGVDLKDLGSHRLKDLPTPEHIYQLVIGGLQADFSPLRSLDARPNNLPMPVTTFVGRERQIEEIKSRLAVSRLLTLTGPGGTGKTRLSIRVAEDLLDEYRDGCWFVPLDALREADLVPSTIASALGVRVPGDRPAIDALSAWLAEKQLLLVLDNFEQITAAGPLIGQMLAAAPGLRVLATSRIPLHIYGENEYAVPPLATVAELRAAAHDPERLSTYEAVRLFIERALGAKSDFTVNNSNAPAVAEICARLDGLPLAIELAAARVKLLSPDQILARLESNLGVLATSAQDLPERQKTMRGAIEWSYQLLTPEEQKLFARLSVFRGGFTLDSAEQVVLGKDLQVDIFDGLASLADKSLLRTVESGSETRFAMLETIREYTTELLAAAPAGDDIRRAHARHYFKLATDSEGHLTAEDQGEWLDTLEREHDNLRAAFSRAGELGMLDDALTAAGAIWRFWQQRGHFTEARNVYDRLLAQPGAAPAARAKALVGGGGIAYWQNDFSVVGPWYSEAVELYKTAGDKAGTAEALFNLSYVPLLEGDLPEAARIADEAVALFETLGDEAGVAKSAQVSAFVDYYSADPSQAIGSLERTAEIYRRHGDQFLLADALISTTLPYANIGKWDDVARLMREGLEIFERIDNKSGIAMVYQIMAAGLAFLGRNDESARLFGASESLRARIGGGAPTQLVNTEQYRKKAEAELGEVRFAELVSQGGNLRDEDALATAMAFQVAPGSPGLPSPDPWGKELERRQAAAVDAASGGSAE
ncbi:MAG TPA: adenylate/guanylate cyclase domain-containing protein [Candidatus Limnocylindria bacterium]|nr:adenylate/guanylate cyclase domain-containing protein [Candidatus Limnocylindria bacterium]